MALFNHEALEPEKLLGIAASEQGTWSVILQRQASDSVGAVGTQICLVSSLNQQSSTFLAPGTGFVEDNFTMDWGVSG